MTQTQTTVEPTDQIPVADIEAQKRFEIHCIEEGVRRFRYQDQGGKPTDDGHTTRKGLADQTATRIIYDDILPGLIKRVTQMRDEAALYCLEPKGQFSLGMLPLALLDPEQTSVIALRGMMADEYSEKALAKKLTSVELKIGNMLFQQLEFEDWKAQETERAKEDKDYISKYKRLLTFLKGQPVNQKQWSRFMSKYGERRARKQRKDAIILGARLVQVLIEEGQGWFEMSMIFERGHGAKVVRFSPEALAALKEQRENCELQKPVLRPMLCPPKPWVRVKEAT